jgi:hypothetical protein
MIDDALLQTQKEDWEGSRRDHGLITGLAF